VNDPTAGTHNTIEKSTVSGQAVQAGTIGSVHFGGTGAGAVTVDRAIRNLAPILDSVLERGFSGREWLTSQIDQFIGRHRCGYVWIEAEAGMGKTALCAQLVRERAWIGHFARLNNGGLARVGLQNLAGQLIAHYEMSDFAPGRMMPEWTFTPEGFETVLARAADRARQAGKPLVLLVDGADEAEIPEGMQPWGLPSLLPAGVFIVGTYRTGNPPPRCDTPRVVLSIHPTDVNNQDDVAAHLDKALHEDELSDRLTEAGVAAAEFAVDAAARCGGIWVYLRYVLDEVRLGLRNPRELGELPADLPSYYTAQLTQWSREPHWHDGLVPLLATLAVIGEPLSAAALARLSGVDETSVRQWCQSTLRPFLTASVPLPGEKSELAEPRRFEIYHASLREVLTGAHIHAAKSEESWAWADALTPAAVMAHRRIADYYLGLFGGLRTDLSALADDPGLAGVDHGYALSHLARHLVLANAWSDLHLLLRVEKATTIDEAVNVWFAAHDRSGTLDGYLADLATARGDCERRTDQALAVRKPAPSLADEMRYLLMSASITSLTNSVPGELLACLLEHGVWSWERALAHAHRLSTPRARAEALAAMIDALPASQRPDAIYQGISAAKIIVKRHVRVQVMASLAAYLSAEQLTETLATARSVADDDVRAEVLARLVPHVPADRRPEVLGEALTATDAISWPVGADLKVLSIMAPHLPSEKVTEILGARLNGTWDNVPDDMPSDALAVLCSYILPGELSSLISEILSLEMEAPQVTESMASGRIWGSPDAIQGKKLAALAGHFPAGQIDDAFRVASSITNAHARVEALIGLLPRLPAHARAVALANALTAVDSIRGRRRQVGALIRLVPHAPISQRSEILGNALNMVTKITYNDTYVRALARLSPELPTHDLSETFTLITAVADEFVRADALADLAPRLSREQLAEALDITRDVNDDNARASALAALAPHLPNEQLTQALDIAREVNDDNARARALTSLAPHLPNEQLTQALSAATSITYVNSRVRALIGLTPHATAEQLDIVLAAVKNITYASVRCRALAGVARHLPLDQRRTVLAEALAAAQTVPRENSRADALAALAPHLLVDQVAQAWDMVEAMTDGDARAKALAGLSPHLSPDQQAVALTYALATPDSGERTKVLVRLAAHLSGELRSRALEDAMTAAQTISNRGKRLRTLAGLADYLPIDKVTKALAATETVVTEEIVALMLEELAPRLPAGQVVKALGIVKTFPDEEYRALALTAISPHLPAEHLPYAASFVPYGYVEPFHLLLKRAEEVQGPTQPGDWVMLLRTILRTVDRNVFLALLKSSTGMLRGLAGPTVAEQLTSAIRDTHRWWL
jgi:hypothetical protein